MGRGQVEALWEKLKTPTAACMQDGAKTLARVWEAAWRAGAGETRTQGNKFKQSDLRTLYMKPDFGRLRNEIKRRFNGWGALHGFGTAARGTDILVLETLAEGGLTATVVLPFPRADFETTSVGDSWNQRLQALEGNGGLQFISLRDSMPAPDQLPAAFSNANSQVFKQAVAYARSLDEKPIVLAVWDGQPGDGPGGTADAVQL